jgi:hypothetical protein
MDIKYLNPTGFAELYTDDTETPVGWERKLTEMRRGVPFPPYPSYDVFDETSHGNKEQCAYLYQLKMSCKDESTIKCKAETPDDELQKKHDRLMECRNIRAIENKANCLYDKVGWLTNDHDGHQKAVVGMGNGARKCLAEYNKRQAKKNNAALHRTLTSGQRSTSRSKRSNSDKRRSNSDKRRSTSGRWRRPKRKSKSRKSTRKRTPSRKMK